MCGDAMMPYEEIAFPNGYLRWLREGDEYVCRMSEGYMRKMKALHEALALIPDQRPVWAALMRGVRVEGDTVVISTKDNNVARVLCGALIEEMNK